MIWSAPATNPNFRRKHLNSDELSKNISHWGFTQIRVHSLTPLMLPNKSNLSYFQRTRNENDKRIFPLNGSSCLEHQALSFVRLSAIERETMAYLTINVEGPEPDGRKGFLIRKPCMTSEPSRFRTHPTGFETKTIIIQNRTQQTAPPFIAVMQSRNWSNGRSPS